MPLKVIGAGLGRTGTLSLKFALEQLGLGPCYHMMEVFRLNHAAVWNRAFSGEAMDWEQVFEGFQSAVDWPSAAFYREHAELWPDAKVILTVRDPDSWFKSTQETIFRDANHGGASPEWLEMFHKMTDQKFAGDLHTKDHVIDVYNRHNDEVRRTIPAERLLEYRPGDGWEPLCAFLGVPVPDTPYPKTNSTEEFQARVAGGPPR
jgi:hypothetical protein